MPIFQKKSNFKQSPTRTGRLSETVCPRVIDSSDPKNLRLDLLDEKELRFVDGIWVQRGTGGGGSGPNARTTELQVDDFLKLKSKMDKLEQENNLLQAKVDILVDMLTENICQAEAEK